MGTHFALGEVELRIPGTIDSNQLAEGPAPLLVSITTQAMLGFLHNKRNGTVQLVDYDYAHIKCYRIRAPCMTVIPTSGFRF